MADYKVHPNIPQEEPLVAFLEALEIPYEILPEEELPKHVLDGIARGQAVFEDGRFISFEEFKRKLNMPE